MTSNAIRSGFWMAIRFGNSSLISTVTYVTIPIVGPGAANVLAETLELCPTRQLLASTDGHMEPEFQWFAIHVWRWALARVLGQYVEWEVLDRSAALSTARAILHDNALRVYQTA